MPAGPRRFGFLFFFFFMMIAIGQVHAAPGSWHGTLRDADGHPVANAAVELHETSGNHDYSSKTSATGDFSFGEVAEGEYTLRVTVGAKSWNASIPIAFKDDAAVSGVLELSSADAVVRVIRSGSGGEGKRTQGSGGEKLSSGEVSSLPLNERDFSKLLLLAAGTMTDTNGAANFTQQFATNGQRGVASVFAMDGVDTSDPELGGATFSNFNVDAIQEVVVETSNFAAEYGQAGGGYINYTMKSGTNQYHGDVYEYLRNSALDARNFFDPSQIPAFRRNQFGAALGGPIVKDRTFFFADYEGLRENQGITSQAIVPSAAVRQGVLCSIPQPGPGGCTTHQVSGAFNPDPATGIDKSVLPYLGLWGLPNAGLIGNGDQGTYSFTAPHITSENFGTARLDHKFSNKDSMFGSYQYDFATATQPDPANDVLVGNSTGRAYVALEETHIFSSQLINSARFGLNRSLHTAQGEKAINPLAANPALGESPGADNPQIDVSGLVSAQPGLNQIERLDFFENSYQGYDDLFWTRGIHGLKMGFAVERVQLNAFDPAPAGEIAFGSLADPASNGFLTNNPIVLTAPLPSAPFIHFNFRSSIFGGYIQDDLRLKPTLTLNLGLRYEMSTVPSEAQGHLSALHSPFNQTFADTIVGKSVFQNPTYRNFEPRLGFAWDPFGNGKTSVRGGFAIFDVLPLPYLLGQFATNTAPFTENGTASNLPAGSFPTGAFDILATNAASNLGLRIPYIQPNPKRNYLMQWNLNIQRELVPNLTASVAYVGSRGVHMIFRADDINSTQPINGTTPPYLWPLPGTALPISPAIGRMDTLQWNNDSYFDGMEVQVEKRMSHGFQMQGSYTWSRAIDGGDGSIASDSFLNSIPGLFYFLPKYRRGPADFNITHNLTINYLWSIPTSDSFEGPLAWAAKGWQLGGIMQIKTGLPFTPLIGGDPLGLLDSAPFGYPDRLTGSGCSAPVNPGNPNGYIKLNCFALPVATPAIAANCAPFTGDNGNPILGTCANLLGNSGRNSVYGPGLVDFDFSVIKDTKIFERFTVQFRAEIFNIFNRTNFNPPLANNTLFDQGGVPNPAAGVLDSTSTSSREVQFALKLIF